VAFGAHFPLDVIAGIALGYGSALAARSLLAGARRGAGVLRSPR
jgi:membrane-associated phospholipid phosphatase